MSALVKLRAIINEIFNK